MLILLASLFFLRFGDGYRAAVFQHQPLQGSTPEETILNNLAIYQRQVQNARDKGADIIVFPEYGLTTLFADPSQYAIDISNDTLEVVPILSSFAKEHHMYIVVNLLEKVQVLGKTKFYNTNLVFARDGRILPKYRKINLAREEMLTAGTDLVTFSTDFGTTFGVFTGSDIFFKNPSRDVLNVTELTDVVYPTAWESILPFFNALSVQRGYVLASGVNLLAASYQLSEQGYGGSGIYWFDGTIAEVFLDTKTDMKSSLLIKDMRKLVARKDPTECKTANSNNWSFNENRTTSLITKTSKSRQFEASNYNFKDVNLAKSTISEKVCRNGFCCTFAVHISKPNMQEVYKLMVYEGRKNVQDVVKDWGICSLLKCANNSSGSCGAISKGTTEFSHIEVNGNFKTINIPVTLTSNLLPVVDVTYCKSDGCTILKTLSSQKDVAIFGIVGEVYLNVSNHNETLTKTTKESLSYESILTYEYLFYAILVIFFAIRVIFVFYRPKLLVYLILIDAIIFIVWAFCTMSLVVSAVMTLIFIVLIGVCCYFSKMTFQLLFRSCITNETISPHIGETQPL